MAIISVKLNIDDSSGVYLDLIQPLRANREVKSFLESMLMAYYEDEDIRQLVDNRNARENPLAKLQESINKANLEHEKAMLSLNILQDYLDKDNTETVSSDIIADIDIESIYKNDSAIEQMKLLLPQKNVESLEGKILERLSIVEAKVESLVKSSLSNMGMLNDKVGGSIVIEPTEVDSVTDFEEPKEVITNTTVSEDTNRPVNGHSELIIDKVEIEPIEEIIQEDDIIVEPINLDEDIVDSQTEEIAIDGDMVDNSGLFGGAFDVDIDNIQIPDVGEQPKEALDPLAILGKLGKSIKPSN